MGGVLDIRIGTPVAGRGADPAGYIRQIIAVHRGEWEMTGQVHGLRYLKSCRGEYVPNPA